MKSVPCAGCGKVYDSYGRAEWTAKRPICPECRTILEKHYPKLKAETEAMADSCTYYFPSRYTIDLPWSGMRDDKRKDVEKSVLDFLHSFPVILAEDVADAKPHPPALFGPEKYDGWNGTYIRMPRKQAEALKKLVAGIAGYAQECRDHGHKEGSNLLGQLMSGELTCEDVNEAMLENKG
jgi:hypothetical protein